MYFGLMLMIVGMLTVFVILALVVIGGRVTILLTNKFAPVRAAKIPRIVKSENTQTSKIAALTAAVNHLTEGRGRVTEIKRIN